MTDIFISYKSERREAAEHLSDILRLNGYSVWFDYGLMSGRDFNRQIERELRAASAVIVLWCSQSTDSEWVNSEAHLAKKLKKLIPVWIEKVDPPLEFIRDHTIDLTRWDGGPRSRELDLLFDQIVRLVGREQQPSVKGLRELEAKWKRFGSRSLVQFPLVSGDNPISSASIKISPEIYSEPTKIQEEIIYEIKADSKEINFRNNSIVYFILSRRNYIFYSLFVIFALIIFYQYFSIEDSAVSRNDIQTSIGGDQTQAKTEPTEPVLSEGDKASTPTPNRSSVPTPQGSTAREVNPALTVDRAIQMMLSTCKSNECYTAAFNVLANRAEAGDADAQLKLANLYSGQYGNAIVEIDPEIRGCRYTFCDSQALTWYNEAAKQGVLDAKVALGRMYETEKGTKFRDANDTLYCSDTETCKMRAVEWYRQASSESEFARTRLAELD